MSTKEQTLAQLLDDPLSQALFGMHNVETYKGWDIYDQDGSTLASKLSSTGVNLLSVKGTSNTHRTAMRLEIDDREAK